MTKPLKLIAANDTFGAVLALTEVLDGNLAIFVTAPEVNGKMPETHGLPNEVADNVAVIVETSGSSGVPKRIEISREALIASADSAALALGSIDEKSQWLLALPINFIAGINVLVRSVLAGTQPVLMNTSVPFTAQGFAHAAMHLSADRLYTSLVPTQLARLAVAANTDEFVLAQLRRFAAILVGGQAPQDQVVDQLRALGVNIVITYGMTETTGGLVYNGTPLAGAEVQIKDGRICLRGPMLANVSVDSDGFFVTNDAGELDESGRLSVLGRMDRVIISGGIKVSLDRVEQLSALVAGVQEIAAAPLADAEWGQRIGICYVGSPEVADDIARALAADLGPSGKPVRVIRVDKLPRLANGKNDLQAIQNLFKEH